jgi:hypothetical protein
MSPTGLTPEDRRRIYEEEKVRLEAQASIKAEKKRGPGVGAILFWTIVGFRVLIVVVSSLSDISSSGSSSIFPLTIGDDAMLTRGGICASREAFAKLMNSAVAKDDYGNLELIASGQAWVPEVGTRLRILGYDNYGGVAIYRIRVLTGQYSGTSGFVLASQARKL